MRFRSLASLLLVATWLIGIAVPQARGAGPAQAGQLQISLVQTLDNFNNDTVAVSEPYAVSERNGTLIFYDVSNPDETSVFSRRDFSNEGYKSYRMKYDGENVYMAHVLGLMIFNFGRLTATRPGPDSALDLDVVGDLAYVAFGTGGLSIFDVSDPENPVLRGSLDTPDRATGVQVVANTAYVADEDGGLRIIDVSNPAAPALRAVVETPASDVQVGGGRAYIAAWNGSVYQVSIINVSNPASPQTIHSFTTQDASLLRLAGDYLITASVADVEFYNISDPTRPVLAGTYQVPGYGINDLAVAGELVFLVSGRDARLLRVTGGDFAPTPVTAAPAPLVSSVSGRAVVNLRWLDIAGARSYEIEVSATDFSGLAVGPGTYTTTADEITVLMEPGSYFFRMRGCNSLGCGPYSPTGQIVVTQSLRKIYLPLLQR